ncbi:MAG: hypothetical protein ACTSV6_08295 [Candidatus Heimdallarchaeota archaeon]
MSGTKRSKTSIATSKQKSKKDKTKASKKKETKEGKKKQKEEQFLKEAKQAIEEITSVLRKTSQMLPSLVSVRYTNDADFNGILHDKFRTDYELISMLEEFFTKLVLLLRYRSAFDEKLSQMSKIIGNLKKATNLQEFQGNLQLLGIALQDSEQIIQNYDEMYNNLFTEQALLQFQLMEQLALFREKNVPNFSELFSDSLKNFLKLNNKLSNLEES